MKLKYRQLSSPAPFSERQKLFRPIIPVSLRSNTQSLRFEALIDSGADFSIFPLGIAKRLTINLPKLQKIYFSSATGNIVEGLISKITLDIGDGDFATNIVFADLPGNVGILGQYGFFEEFIINFNHKKKEIELNRRR